MMYIHVCDLTVDSSKVVLHTYKCCNTSLCNSCRLRFRCFTQRDDELFINYKDIRKDGLEWNFALEKYMHGRILSLTERTNK